MIKGAFLHQKARGMHYNALQSWFKSFPQAKPFLQKLFFETLQKFWNLFYFLFYPSCCICTANKVNFWYPYQKLGNFLTWWLYLKIIIYHTILHSWNLDFPIHMNLVHHRFLWPVFIMLWPVFEITQAERVRHKTARNLNDIRSGHTYHKI